MHLPILFCVDPLVLSLLRNQVIPSHLSFILLTQPGTGGVEVGLMKLSANIRDGGPGLYLYRNDQKRIIGTFKFTAEYLIFMGSNIWYVTGAKVCRVGRRP